jgi:REP element-mobilizing transposase RayT
MFHPDRHHRNSIRLRGRDYARAGAYFVTICTYQRAHLFGEIDNGQMRMNAAGLIAAQEWNRLPSRQGGLGIDAFVIMPNHLHGVIVLDRLGPPTLGVVIRAFKAAAARAIRLEADPDFAWQRNYYERIIRTDSSMDRVRAYIVGNPTRWALDKENAP